jgi:hypothetical protein
MNCFRYDIFTYMDAKYEYRKEMLMNDNIDNNNNNQEKYSYFQNLFFSTSHIHRQLYTYACMYVLELNNITFRFTGR